MSDIGDVFKKQLRKKTEELDYSGSSNFLEQISEEFETEVENNKILQFKKNLSKSSKETKQKVYAGKPTSFFEGMVNIELEAKEQIVQQETIAAFFESLSSKEELIEQILIEEPILEIQQEELVEEVLFEPEQDFITNVVVSISKEEANKNYTNLFKEPSANKPDPDIKALQNKMKFLEDWIAKISMAGPGGGEVNFRYLDDVDPNSIGENKYLTYNQGNRKFYFDYVTSNTISNNTRLVTSNTYSLVPDDYYVGINYAGPTTITLQPTAQNGKVVVIKDESGNCSINPITVTGNVDNDSGGFILKINNGAIQMIYRNGWRII